MRARLPAIAGALLLGSAAFGPGCSSSSAPSYTPPPASAIVVDPGPWKIRKEVLTVAGVTPPPNPRGPATPPEENALRVVRYRVDATPPKPARAVVVMMPGDLGGAGSFDALARAIVRRSAEGDALEAWAIDRRANLLEDTFGLDVAEVKKDPSLARRYYIDGDAIEGRTFAGFLSGSAYPWASEWGLATTLGDLKNVIAKIPDAERPRRVVLLGHSLGGQIVEEYAAWDFDGTPGTKEIAGLVLLDGAAENEGAAPETVSESAYEQGGGPSDTGIGPGLGVESDVRAGNVFVSIPLLGVKAEVVGEYVAMSARMTPDAIETDETRDQLLSVLLGLPSLPKMTDRAAFGFAFDEASSSLSFAQISCGAARGGPVTPYQNALGTMTVHPSDPNATYAWTDYADVTPREATSIDDAARGWYEGPGVNFAEWYFPARLTLDANAAGTLNVKTDDWRATKYGLFAAHGDAIDVPILAVAMGYYHGDVAVYGALQKLAGPIGAGRPHAGASRQDSAAFSSVGYSTLTHLDGLTGADDAGTPVRDWYDRLAAFVRDATPPGGVVIP